MNTDIANKQTVLLEALVEDLDTIKKQLNKFVLLIPEEDLRQYKNSTKIKKAYLKAVRLFPPN